MGNDLIGIDIILPISSLGLQAGVKKNFFHGFSQINLSLNSLAKAGPFFSSIPRPKGQGNYFNERFSCRLSPQEALTCLNVKQSPVTNFFPAHPTGKQ
jgi:hypothetical protein